MSKRSQQINTFFRQGQQMHMAGRLAEAEHIYRQVIAAMPRHADALHALGALALQAGRPAVADTLLCQAIGLKPAADFQLTRAHALLALNRPQEAAQVARLVLRARSQSAEAHQVLGHALSDSRQPEQAIEAYRTALHLKPGLPDIRNNLGTALRHANRLAEAEQELGQAPPQPESLVNLSSVQKERGAFADAAATLQRALRIAPDNPVLRYNWSLLMLLLGRTEEAWAGWEERFRAGAIPPRPFTQPQWHGEPLGGRTLLIHTEQGFGDVIQFARYLPAIRGAMIDGPPVGGAANGSTAKGGPANVGAAIEGRVNGGAANGGNVIFEAPPRLIRLLSSNSALPRMIPAGVALPAVDTVVPLLSLPARTNLPAVQPPYLFAEPDRITAWKDRIGTSGFRVGVNWQGFSGRSEDRGRSIPLATFQPLAAEPGVRLISLQKSEGEEQIPTAGFPLETLDGLDAGPDAFLDTAAVMANLDLVITSDTSIAHLAGALGCAVWVALRKVPDWRWMLDRTDSPWYPTMRLFRQTRDGEWTPVFAAMAQALRSLVVASDTEPEPGLYPADRINVCPR
jgi:Flp pilus assembly protein TadD